LKSRQYSRQRKEPKYVEISDELAEEFNRLADMFDRVSSERLGIDSHYPVIDAFAKWCLTAVRNTALQEMAMTSMSTGQLLTVEEQGEIVDGSLEAGIETTFWLGFRMGQEGKMPRLCDEVHKPETPHRAPPGAN
jgi:hypothetical protein